MNKVEPSLRWISYASGVLACCVTPIVMFNAYLFVHSAPFMLFVAAPGIFLVGMFGVRDEVLLTLVAIPVDFGYYYALLRAVVWLGKPRAGTTDKGSGSD
jgi:hypothetical protein